MLLLFHRSKQLFRCTRCFEVSLKHKILTSKSYLWLHFYTCFHVFPNTAWQETFYYNNMDMSYMKREVRKSGFSRRKNQLYSICYFIIISCQTQIVATRWLHLVAEWGVFKYSYNKNGILYILDFFSRGK